MFRKLATPDPDTGATHAGPRKLMVRPGRPDEGAALVVFRNRPSTGIARVATLAAAAEYVRDSGL